MKATFMTLALILLMTSPGLAGSQTGQGPGEVERIFGTNIGPEGLEFQVFSSGCTDKEDFRLERYGSGTKQLLLIRVIPDFCDAFIPYGVRIRYSFEELGLNRGDRCVVLNPPAEMTVYTP